MEMNMKRFTILVLIGIAVITLIVFFYSFTYNLAFGQLENNDFSISQQSDSGSDSIPYPNEEILTVVIICTGMMTFNHVMV
jgi:hypothetical protein